MVNGKPGVPFERRQSYCPQCESVRGNPFRVTATPDRLVIAYRCEVCRRQWEVRRAAPVTVAVAHHNGFA